MKYLIYLRVSTEKQDVEMQRKTIMNYLKTKHLDNNYSYEIFSDPETSSRIPMEERSGLQEMLNSVKKGMTVLVYKLDRLSRDIIEMVTIFRKITKECKAVLHSLNDADCNSAFNVGLMGVFAEKEREDIRIKTKDALRVKKERGERYSSKLPYGFTLHETHMVPIRVGNEIVYKKGVLVKCQTEQKAIERMIQYSELGLTYSEICKALTAEGFKNREGNPFQKMTVHRIVAREKKLQQASFPHLQQTQTLLPV